MDNACPGVERFMEKFGDVALELEMRIKDLDFNWRPEWERTNMESH
jgi:hypothetical protein